MLNARIELVLKVVERVLNAVELVLKVGIQHGIQHGRQDGVQHLLLDSNSGLIQIPNRSERTKT